MSIAEPGRPLETTNGPDATNGPGDAGPSADPAVDSNVDPLTNESGWRPLAPDNAQPEEHLDGVEARRRLRELLQGARVMVVASPADDGHLHSRPLALIELDDDARLWAFVDVRSDWVRQLSEQPKTVNVTVSDESHNKWTCISGSATVVRDAVRAERLWRPELKELFLGPDDPSLRLLCVASDVVEFWLARGGSFSRMLASAKVALTGEKPFSPGDRGTLIIPPVPS